MLLGSELSIDASGCNPQALADLATMRALCERVLRELDLHLVGEPQWHQFPLPGGVTGLYLLSESHLACHTFPEHGFATFNLYCCRERPSWDWRENLRLMLGAEHVRIRRLLRVAHNAQEADDIGITYDQPKVEAP